MSQQVQVLLLDDLDLAKGDEVPAGRTVPFELDGIKYEIDLSAEHEKRLFEGMNPFVAAARRVGAARAGQPRRPRTGRARSAQIREWARDRNIELKERGRIPRWAEEQYDRDHA